MAAKGAVVSYSIGTSRPSIATVRASAGVKSSSRPRSAPGAQGRPRVLDAHERRRRRAEAREEALGLDRHAADRGPHRRRERRADAGDAVAVLESAYAEVRGGEEGPEAMPGPDELRLVEGEIDGAEGERERPALDRDLVLLAARDAFREAAVVEVEGEAVAGVRRVEALLVAVREEERVGVDRRRREVLPLAAPVAVVEGELREGEEPALVAARAEARVDLREGTDRVLLVGLPQAGALEELERAVRGAAAGEHVRRELALDPARVFERDADRRPAADGEERERQRGGEAEAPHRAAV